MGKVRFVTDSSDASSHEKPLGDVPEVIPLENKEKKKGKIHFKDEAISQVNHPGGHIGIANVKSNATNSANPDHDDDEQYRHKVRQNKEMLESYHLNFGLLLINKLYTKHISFNTANPIEIISPKPLTSLQATSTNSFNPSSSTFSLDSQNSHLHLPLVVGLPPLSISKVPLEAEGEKGDEQGDEGEQHHHHLQTFEIQLNALEVGEFREEFILEIEGEKEIFEVKARIMPRTKGTPS